MGIFQASEAFKDSISKAGSAQDDFPVSYWITLTNNPPGSTYISLPQGGNLWVYYEWGNTQAKSIYVWHQGGATTPIVAGQNTIAVNEWDAIVYELNDPINDTIKLGYQYV